MIEWKTIPSRNGGQKYLLTGLEWNLPSFDPFNLFSAFFTEILYPTGLKKVAN
jgi:hypothetical protein